MKIAILILSIFVVSAAVTWMVYKPRHVNNPQESTHENLPLQNPDTIKSNKWYSSIYKALPTSPIYVMPLALQFTNHGLGFSYPKLLIEPNTIFAPYNEDFSVGVTDDIQNVHIDQVGDWHINTIATTESGASMSAVITHAVPYVHLESKDGKWIIRAKDIFEVSDQQSNSAIIKVHDNNYLLSWPDAANVQVSTATISISDANRLFVALLDDPKSRSVFNEVKDSAIRGTFASWEVKTATIDTTFHIDSASPSLITLYPHQLDSITIKPNVIGEYQTIRGKLSLIKSNSFTTSIQKLIPEDTFPTMSVPSQKISSTLVSDVNIFVATPVPDSKSYGLSVWMGRAANLISLADTLQLPEQKQKIISKVLPVLKDLKNFYIYDQSQFSQIALKPEFGSERLNDHHFHYGYIIRLAAQIVKNVPEETSNISPFVSELVADIANINRQSQTYPFLRNFDIYESHSWADGYAQFADGNNQESSSEAINAWYGIYEWAKVTNNSNLQAAALYLYNAEIHGTKYYWFNIADIYPKPYAHQIASLIWGGKVDYITWFGDVANFKYGIQLLPLTPASLYLKDIPNYFNYEADFVRSGGNYQSQWGELMTIWKSYTNKDVSTSDLPKLPETTPLSVLEYLIYSNTKNLP